MLLGEQLAAFVVAQSAPETVADLVDAQLEQARLALEPLLRLASLTAVHEQMLP